MAASIYHPVSSNQHLVSIQLIRDNKYTIAILGSCSKTLHTQVPCSLVRDSDGVCICPLKPGIEVSPFPVFLHLPTLSTTPQCVGNTLTCKFYLSLGTWNHLSPPWAPRSSPLSTVFTHNHRWMDLPTYLLRLWVFNGIYLHTASFSSRILKEDTIKIGNSKRRKCQLL